VGRSVTNESTDFIEMEVDREVAGGDGRPTLGAPPGCDARQATVSGLSRRPIPVNSGRSSRISYNR